jgi:hypothetical protein
MADTLPNFSPVTAGNAGAAVNKKMAKITVFMDTLSKRG